MLNAKLTPPSYRSAFAFRCSRLSSTIQSFRKHRFNVSPDFRSWRKRHASSTVARLISHGFVLCGFSGRGLGRQLAAVARAAAERRQQRKEFARQMVRRRERYLEAADAGLERFDADHLGRHHFPERLGYQEPFLVGRRTK